MERHPNIVSSVLTANVRSVDDLRRLDNNTESIIVESNCFNEGEITSLNLSRFTSLKSFIVGDNSFGDVNELIIDGLPELESIKIGINSFIYYDGDHMFSVKNCPKLRELKIGPSCFFNWDSVEIENDPSLEVIEIGYLYYSSGNFNYAPLELKSSIHRMEMINRPAQVEIAGLR